MSDGPKITVLPPGEARGAHDLENWGKRRLADRSHSDSGVGRSQHNGEYHIKKAGSDFWKAKRRQAKFRAIDRKFGRIP